MKTKKAMKKITHIGMAALVAMGMLGTSCNKAESPEIETPETQKENIVTLTTTVGFAADDTKALTPAGVKTFAEGETMAIYYWKNKGNDHVKAVSAPLTAGDITNGGKNATFTFTLDNPYKDMSVVYTYPAAMANADFTPNYDALYNNQDGTLATLASNFDFCTRSGAWSGGNLPTLTLENQLAILAITLKNEAGTSEITSSITGMTVSDGTNTYTVSRSATAGPIYVAIRPTASASIYITATNGTTSYAKTLTGKTYAAGNGYSVSWRMNKAVIWNSSKVAGIEIWSDGSFESDGITVAVSSEEGNAFFAESDIYLDAAEDKFTFSSSVGNIMKIEIHHSDYGNWYGPSAGWNGNGDDGYESDGGGTFTWEGTPAAEVTLSSSDETGDINDITSIVFTIEQAPAGPTAYTLAESTVGMIVGSNGKAYAVADKDNLPSGVTAVAIVAYKGSETGEASPYTHGLAIAMKDAAAGGKVKWSSSDNDESLDNYTDYSPAVTTAQSGLSNSQTSGFDNESNYPAFYAALHNTITVSDGISAVAPASGTSGWFLPSLYQWNKIVQGLSGKTADLSHGGNANANYTASSLNPKIEAAGGSGLQSGAYWPSTEYSSPSAWYFYAGNGSVGYRNKTGESYVRSVLAF